MNAHSWKLEVISENVAAADDETAKEHLIAYHGEAVKLFRFLLSPSPLGVYKTGQNCVFCWPTEKGVRMHLYIILSDTIILGHGEA
jgi:hypothetical protein